MNSRVTDEELLLFIYGGLRDPEATARIVAELQDTQSSIRERMKQIDPIKGDIDLSQWPIVAWGKNEIFAPAEPASPSPTVVALNRIDDVWSSQLGWLIGTARGMAAARAQTEPAYRNVAHALDRFREGVKNGRAVGFHRRRPLWNYLVQLTWKLHSNRLASTTSGPSEPAPETAHGLTGETTGDDIPDSIDFCEQFVEVCKRCLEMTNSWSTEDDSLLRQFVELSLLNHSTAQIGELLDQPADFVELLESLVQERWKSGLVSETAGALE